MSHNQRAYLEQQADRLEAVLHRHRAPARVTGGTVGPRSIRFFINPAPQTRLSSIKRLEDEIALALHARQVRFKRDAQYGVVMEFPNPRPQAIALDDILKLHSEKTNGMAVLGMADGETPLLVKITSPAVAHILISGTTGSGKSVLLRSIVTSLLKVHNVRELLLIGIDPKNRLFPVGFACGHLLAPIVTSAAEAEVVLNQVVALMAQRDAARYSQPLVVIVIDELADLLMENPAIEAPLLRIGQRGREAGLHLIAATQRPSADVISGTLRANFPLRLVGKVVSPEEARVAAGCGGTGAEKLGGRGDFIAVGEGDSVRFVAPWVTESELQKLSTGVKPRISLPAVELVELAEPVAPDVLLERFKPWWSKNSQRWEQAEWGVQSEVIKILYPDDPRATNAGAWRDNMLSVVARMQRVTA